MMSSIYGYNPRHSQHEDGRTEMSKTVNEIVKTMRTKLRKVERRFNPVTGEWCEVR